MRPRKCKACKKPFRPPEGLKAVVCSPECGLSHHRALQAKADRARLRARKEALRGKSWHLKRAQQEFNAFIRLRDANLPCVSCGRFHNGQWHAGHYRPVGGQGAALRFNELNCHRQCAPCNNHKSGALSDYRIELIRRTGLSLVEWLERDHPPPKWTIEEIKAIREYYRRARKEMLQAPGESEPF